MTIEQHEEIKRDFTLIYGYSLKGFNLSFQSKVENIFTMTGMVQEHLGSADCKLVIHLSIPVMEIIKLAGIGRGISMITAGTKARMQIGEYFPVSISQCQNYNTATVDIVAEYNFRDVVEFAACLHKVAEAHYHEEADRILDKVIND